MLGGCNNTHSHLPGNPTPGTTRTQFHKINKEGCFMLRGQMRREASEAREREFERDRPPTIVKEFGKDEGFFVIFSA